MPMFLNQPKFSFFCILFCLKSDTILKEISLGHFFLTFKNDMKDTPKHAGETHRKTRAVYTVVLCIFKPNI